MTKGDRLAHVYVEFIPKEIDGGILYISRRFNTAAHRCCCGCGFKVVTPLNAAKWNLVDHGDTVSLAPSIGLGALPCRSHYWIRRGRVDWYAEMTATQTRRARQRDEYASRVFTGEIKPPPARESPRQAPSQRPGFWASIKAWWDSLWS